jgi:chaperonin GroES
MTNLPTPTGYRLITKPRELENKTAGGIILTDESKEAAKFKCVVAKVVAMGPECYSGMDRSSTKWCKEGDWVLTGKYVGLKFRYDGDEYSLINDDEVLAVIADPTKISAK